MPIRITFSTTTSHPQRVVEIENDLHSDSDLRIPAQLQRGCAQDTNTNNPNPEQQLFLSSFVFSSEQAVNFSIHVVENGNRHLHFETTDTDDDDFIFSIQDLEFYVEDCRKLPPYKTSRMPNLRVSFRDPLTVIRLIPGRVCTYHDDDDGYSTCAPPSKRQRIHAATSHPHVSFRDPLTDIRFIPGRVEREMMMTVTYPAPPPPRQRLHATTLQQFVFPPAPPTKNLFCETLCGGAVGL